MKREAIKTIFGELVNPYALDIGLSGFGSKWREFYKIPTGTKIHELLKRYEKFKLSPPITFDEYMSGLKEPRLGKDYHYFIIPEEKDISEQEEKRIRRAQMMHDLVGEYEIYIPIGGIE